MNVEEVVTSITNVVPNMIAWAEQNYKTISYLLFTLL